MLPVECSTALVLQGNYPLDRGEVRLAECIVWCAMKTFTSATGLYGLHPDIHDPPADEGLYRLGGAWSSIPSML
jgi:hypothetical protein